MSTSAPVAPSRRLRRWLQAAAAAALLVVASLIALPHAIRWQAVKWLRTHGHTSASIEDVDFNLFSGRLSVHALGGGTSVGEELELSRLEVQVDWLPLLGHRVMVQDLELQDVGIDLRRQDDGTLLVGRLAFPPAPRSASWVEEEPGRPWMLGLGNLDLDNVTVRYSDALLDGNLLVRELHIDPALEWEPERTTAFQAELVLDEETWRLEGTVKPFAKPLRLDTRVRLEGNVKRRYPRLLAKLGIENLVLQANTDTHLEVSFDRDDGTISANHTSTVQLRDLAMTRADWLGGLSALDWDGTVRITGSVAAPVIEVEGTLSLAGYSVRQPAKGFHAAGESLSWQGQVQSETGADRSVATVHGALEVGGLALTRGDIGPRSVRLRALRIDLEELRVASTTGSEVWHVEADGAVNASGLSAEGLGDTLHSAGLEEVDVTLDPLRLGADAGGGPLTFEHNGELHLKGISAAAQPGSLATAELDWRGASRLSAAAELGAALSGELKLSKLAVSLAAAPLEITQQQLEYRGDFALTLPEEGGVPGIGARGELVTKHTLAANRDSGMAVFELDGLSLGGLDVAAPERIGIGRVQWEELRVLQNKPENAGASADEGTHVLSLATLRVDDIALHRSNRMEIGTIRLAGLEAWLTRQADGELAFRQALPDLRRPATTPQGLGDGGAPSPEPQQGPALTVGLGEAHLDGDNRLVYLDRSVEPPFRFEISPFEAHVGKMDSGNRAGMSPVSVDARSGKYATISVAGEVGVFAARPTLQLAVEARAIDLAKATALAQRYAGYRIRSGHLDADLRGGIDQGVLDSLTEITANRLELVKLDPKKLDAMDQELGLPLNSALNLLRDSDDNIHLKIPVQGDLSDPDIDIGQAVRTALVAGMGKAVKAGALTYLAAFGSTLFLPVGAAVAAGKAISLASALSFAPVSFPSGEQQLTPEAREQADKLATLLAERPKMRLALCGIATPLDRQQLQAVALGQQQLATTIPAAPQPNTKNAPPALPEIPEQKLLDLALSRGEALKLYLVESRGIDAGRLLVCSPEVEAADDASPRVEVSL